MKVSEPKFQNASIDVDVKGKKVAFSYLRPDVFESFKELYMLFLTIYLFMWFILLLIMTVADISVGTAVVIINNDIQALDNGFEAIAGIVGLLFFVTFPPLIGTLFGWIFKKQLSLIYPKTNAYIASFMTKPIKKVITVIEEKHFRLEYFKNVKLEYKAFGDFSKYLKRIRILPLLYKDGDDKEYGWYAIFDFEQKPTDGRMEIEYI